LAQASCSEDLINSSWGGTHTPSIFFNVLLHGFEASLRTIEFIGLSGILGVQEKWLMEKCKEVSHSGGYLGLS
jgi:hypothetical protein